MATNNGKNMMDSILDAQKNMVETLVENTKKVSNNSFFKETLEKGTDAYNDWINKGQETLKAVTEKAETVRESTKENLDKTNEFYQNWFNTQLGWVKQAWEMNQHFIKNNIPAAESVKNNPADWFKEVNNNWTKWMTQANHTNQWINLMKQYDPSSRVWDWQKAPENWSGLFTQYNELLNNSFAELQKNMQNATTQDAYHNMINVASGFGKFYEMWAPFWKSIQENTFDTEQFKSAFNQNTYKELMDNFFGFIPENNRQYMDQVKEWFTAGMKNYSGLGQNQFDQARQMFSSMNPFAGQNGFEQVLNGYQQMHSAFQNAVAPIAKMISPNAFTKNAAEWSDIMDRMAVFQIKNAEMQYLVYEQSQKVMEALLDNIREKMNTGGKPESVLSLYQEWLNISDKVYVELFESDEYSKIMSEVSALQLKLRKDMDLQAEKMLSNVPVATRSELDELYKVIYDLKKEVRQLEKMMDLDEEGTVAAKGTAKGPAGRKTTASKK